MMYFDDGEETAAEEVAETPSEETPTNGEDQPEGGVEAASTEDGDSASE